ncbi:MAG: SDR family NAD(P)-dependent oxidoreductase [Candidatus Dadabacteria bacterium]|nr:SDR family NAD(P)-dependent oxidoreductase [Candidatus Dadabacteria bacterium]MDE0519886.1 SDR family NAD(P)-dependent oxidoreductase [Candidatus Dadabacteria bacterium]MDE0663482.1 SDR family NAD(P)-dependent oxidoreductase [Candidatus Dadabacteria bacterium]
MRFKGRSAIITGGGTGIGEATALLLARNGARVLIAGRREEKLKELCDRAEEEGLSIEYKVCDVSVESDCAATVETAFREHGKVDILFNNAGIIFSCPLHEVETPRFQEIFDINVKGAFMMCKYAIPHMISAGRGFIVNNSSVVGLKGFAGLSAYSASKGALVQLTRSMALEYADKGLRINAVCPGGVWTPMFDSYLERAEDAEAAQAFMESLHPMGRLADPYEIAEAVLFLCDDKVMFNTGSMLSVDGGVIAK